MTRNGVIEVQRTGPCIFIWALRKFLRWRSNSVVCSRRPCSSADEDRVRRMCIRRRRSGGMEPVAVLRSQLSILGQFQDGAEDIFLHSWHLTPHFLPSCCCMHYMNDCVRRPWIGCLLWRLRSYHDIIIIFFFILLVPTAQASPILRTRKKIS